MDPLIMNFQESFTENYKDRFPKRKLKFLPLSSSLTLVQLSNGLEIRCNFIQASILLLFGERRLLTDTDVRNELGVTFRDLPEVWESLSKHGLIEIQAFARCYFRGDGL